jgi:hypothetical protein
MATDRRPARSPVNRGSNPCRNFRQNRQPNLAKDAQIALARGDQQGPALRRRDERPAAAITALVPCHRRYHTHVDFRRAGCSSPGALGVAPATTSRSSCSRASGCGQRLLGRSAAAAGPRLALPLPAIIPPSSCQRTAALLRRSGQRGAAEPSPGQGRRTKARLAGAGQTLKREWPEAMPPKSTLAHGVLGSWCWRPGAGPDHECARRGW